MALKNGMKPVHPGEILREDVIPAMGITVAKFADMLKVSRVTASRLINEKQGVSPEMALRLSMLFGNSAQFWLNLQNSYDLKTLRLDKKVTGDIDSIRPYNVAV
jgi:addiction module HigA family antidote